VIDTQRVRIVPEFPRLVISDTGVIWGPSGRRLKQFPKRHGYLFITLYPGPQRWVHVPVHAVVCTAFHGPRPEGLQVRHLNGCNTDNRAANLEWGTGAENQADRILHGTDHRGERNYKTTLTEADVRQIRDLRAWGFSRVQIGDWYSITPSAVGKIAARINWGWLV
jgi:HNH endonuclease